MCIPNLAPLLAGACAGTLPAMNYSKFQNCGGSQYVTNNGLELFHTGPQHNPSSAAYRAKFSAGECCYLSAANNAGIYTAFDCPLPDGAAEYCHAVCGNSPKPFPPPAPPPPRPPAPTPGPPPPVPPPAPPPGSCNQSCTAPSNTTFPVCDVEAGLNFGNDTLWRVGGITSAYCNSQYLVVNSDGIPNHEVFLEEIPKPPGAPTDQPYPTSPNGRDQGNHQTLIN